MFINIITSVITTLLTIFITEYKNIIKLIVKLLYGKIVKVFAFLMYKKEVYFYKKGEYRYSWRILENKLKNRKNLTEKEKKLLDYMIIDFTHCYNNLYHNTQYAIKNYKPSTEAYKKEYSKYLDFFGIEFE